MPTASPTQVQFVFFLFILFLVLLVFLFWWILSQPDGSPERHILDSEEYEEFKK